MVRHASISRGSIQIIAIEIFVLVILIISVITISTFAIIITIIVDFAIVCSRCLWYRRGVTARLQGFRCTSADRPALT